MDSNNILWLMDIETGNSEQVGFTHQGMNALTFSSQGILYGASSFELDVFSININTGAVFSLGKMEQGSYSSGDLNFYKGDLYLFAIDKKVIKIDLEDISLSRTITTTSLNAIFGSTSAGCDSRFYVSSDLNLYEIANLNFLTPQTVCSDLVSCVIFGATSLVESVNNLDLGPDRSLCTGEEITLYATPDAIAYKWQDGSTANSFHVTESGKYWVEQTNLCGTLSDTIEVKLDDFPEIEVSEDLSFCAGRSATLTVNSNSQFSEYKWSTGNSSSFIEVETPGLYSVDVRLGNCLVSASILVEEEFCETVIELPNVFTPNDDGTNELFIPIRVEEIKSMKTIIFDRTGNKLYETDDLAIRWNGTFENEREAADGVYFYWVSYTNFLDVTNEIRGTITLLR